MWHDDNIQSDCTVFWIGGIKHVTWFTEYTNMQLNILKIFATEILD